MDKIDIYIDKIKEMVNKYDAFEESYLELVEYAKDNITVDDFAVIEARDDFDEIQDRINTIGEMFD